MEDAIFNRVAFSDNYIYSPPAWRVCPTCKGDMYISYQLAKEKFGELHAYMASDSTYMECPTCKDSSKPGRIPIYYTPEQWQEAGGVLQDDMPVWVHVDSWNVDEWQLIEYNKTFDTMFDVVIATEAGKPPEDYNGT